ncbi:hypothetical protein [Streptomyces sp. NPDC001820]|uniref:hypothetical protein n=1 Tax=Streptomyces sp. NPDC001820 TaxID=3364613 RepID=UPI0036918B00
MRASGLEEKPRFSGVQGVHLLAFDGGCPNDPGDVARDEFLTDGLLERRPKYGVDVLDGPSRRPALAAAAHGAARPVFLGPRCVDSTQAAEAAGLELRKEQTDVCG